MQSGGVYRIPLGHEFSNYQLCDLPCHGKIYAWLPVCSQANGKTKHQNLSA